MSTNKPVLSRRRFLQTTGMTMGILALSACAPGAAVPAAGDDGTAPAAEAVILAIMLPGDRPAQMDEVLEEVHGRLADAGLPTTLNITFIPWGADLASKPSLALAAGEPVDLVFDAPWNTLLQNVAQEYYVWLDDPDNNLLEAHGSNILAARPEQMWQANRIGGKVWAIPLGVQSYQGRQWLFRDDIREEMGFPEIVSGETTFEEFEEFIYAVKVARPDMIPARAAGVGHQLFADFDTSLRGITNPDIRMLYLRGNDATIRSMFDDRDPLFWSAVERGARWRADGLIPPETDPGTVYRTTGGRTVVESANDFGPPTADINAVEALGGRLGWVTFFDRSKRRVVNFLQFNFIAVAHSSQNPVRSIEFLNWANVQENYDLLAYGIEGEHWEAVGSDEYRVISDTPYRWYPYAWVWNPTHDRLNADAAPGANDWVRWSQDADNFEPDVLVGFTPDEQPVLNEVSQLNSWTSQYWDPLAGGFVDDIDSWWGEFEGQAAVATRTIQAEYQSQADAFLESNM